MSIDVRVRADGKADVLVCDAPRLSLDADEALELFRAFDRELDNCHRCNKTVWLDLVRVCGRHGAYCDAHEECHCLECRAGAA